MRRRVKGNVVQSAKRAEGVALENDNWIWVVIFATTALTALAVVALFTIAAG
jgi:hypothetical protein